MYGKTSNYAALLAGQKIKFVPTCLIMEIMATTHSHLSRLPLHGNLNEEMLSFTIFVLQRFLNDVKSTYSAYGFGKVDMFIGDWRNDRSKAGGIFAHLMIKADKTYNRSYRPYRAELAEVIKQIRGEWELLFNLLDEKTMVDRQNTSCRYFHSCDPLAWHKTMANIVLSLSEESRHLPSDTYLLLLCNTRIKRHLIRQVREIEKKNQIKEKFNEDTVICVSDHDIRVTCPACLQFSEAIVRTTRIHKTGDTRPSFRTMSTV